ncbi:MAG: ABC transporter permease [Christensenellales bacterium]|jgi:ribose transport system permease protein
MNATAKNATFKKIMRSNTFMAVIMSVLLLLIGQIISPGFAAPSNILNLLMIAAFLGIITLAQMVVMVVDSGGIDLSVGSILQFSMIFIAQLCAYNSDNFWYASILSLLICAVFGLINGIGVAVLKIPPLIMTLSMSSVIIGVMLIFTGGFPTGMAPPSLSRFVYGEILYLPNMIWVWVLTIVIVMILTKRTNLGRMLYGVGANRMTAELSGVNTQKVRALVYAVSGLVCGLAGMFLLGYMSTPNNLETGSGYVMPSIAAAVVGGISLSGGKGDYIGAVMGVIFLTILEAMLMTIKMGEPVRKIIYGVVVVAILINYARKNRKK